MATLRIPILDHGSDKSTLEWDVADAISDADITLLVDAVDALHIGTRDTVTLRVDAAKDTGSSVPPADKFAQKETKWSTKYVDNVTGKVYRREIPCANLDEVVTGTEVLDTGVGTAGEDYVTEFEKSFLSPDGNAVTHISTVFIARNT